MHPATSSRPQFVTPKTKTWQMIDLRVNIPGERTERTVNNGMEKHDLLPCCSRALFPFVTLDLCRAYLDLALDRRNLYGRHVNAFQKIIGPYLWLYIPTGDIFLLLLLLSSARINCS